MRHLWTAAALAALLAGCHPQAASKPPATAPAAAPAVAPKPAPTPALAVFSHAKGEDLFGYYSPDKDVKIGVMQLDQIHIGSEEEFDKWERGERIATYAPVMLEFSDLSSAKSQDENGVTVYAHTIRVLPTAYKVGGGHLSFTGADPVLGAVQLDGEIDMAALKRAQAESAKDDDVILRAALQIGTTTFKALTFDWFGGD